MGGSSLGFLVPFFVGCSMSVFSVVRSRSFCRGGVRPLVAPWWRSLVGSALSAGACRWRVRLSGRSFSGAVVVVGFRSSSAASAFAAAWAGAVGFPCVVRCFAGGVFGVSVPVAVSPALALLPAAALPASCVWVSGV